jgi:hypothetical protein
MSLLSEGNRSHLNFSVRLVATTSAFFIATYQTADSCSYNQNVECHFQRMFSFGVLDVDSFERKADAT